MHQLASALDGDLDELIDEMEARVQSEKLREATAPDAADERPAS